MNRFVALYRGINVGGTGVVKMELLRAMHERLGHEEVASYIQSGNVVFSGSGETEKIARSIAKEFEKAFGFAARVMVVPGTKWGAMVRENPYAKESAKDPKGVHAGICDGAPSKAGLAALLKKTGGPETFEIKGAVIYLHAPDGVGNSKFAAGLEKACGVPVTMRNWRTVEAIRGMVGGLRDQ